MSDQTTDAPEGGTEEVNRDAFGIEGQPPGEVPEGEVEQPVEHPPGSSERLAADLTAVFEEREKRSAGTGGAGGEAPSPPAEPPSTEQEGEGDEPTEPPAGTTTPPEAPTGDAPPSPTPTGEPPSPEGGQQQVVIPGGGEQVDLEAAFRQQYGRIPTRAELDAIFQFQADVQRLAVEDPARLAQIEALMYAQAQQQVTGQPPVPPTSTVPGTQTATDDEPDPYLEAALGPMREQLGQVTSFVQGQAQQQMADQQRQVAEQIGQGYENFVKEFGLSDDEGKALENAVVNAGIMGGLYSAHGAGDKAMYQAMSQMYWSTPEFRQREFEKAAHVQAVQEADTTQRKVKAGAVAGSSGSVTRDEPLPTTRAGRLAAMAQEIETAQAQGG